MIPFIVRDMMCSHICLLFLFGYMGDNKKDVENFSCSLEVGGFSSLAGNRQELKLRVTVRCNWFYHVPFRLHL